MFHSSIFLRRVSLYLFISSALALPPKYDKDDVPPEPKYKIAKPATKHKTTKDESFLKELQNPWETGDLFESDIMIPEDDGDRNGLEDESKRWPNATLVYYIDKKHFTPLQLQGIEAAMSEIRNKTCVRFRPYQKGDRAFVRVRGNDDQGCASFVGRMSGGQELNLEPPYCLKGHGTALHEMLHALGFAHQHSAPDRDKYIKVILENIAEERKRNFDKQEDLTDFGVGYDYGSVMHYSNLAGTKNGKPTIEPLDKTAQIGQRLGLSEKDAEKIRRMYGCPKKKTEKPRKNKIGPKKYITVINKITTQMVKTYVTRKYL